MENIVLEKYIYFISTIIDMNPHLNLFKALSEETRFRIIEVLLKGEKCACEIPYLIHRTQSNTSMHLSKLLQQGMIKSRRDGKKIIYSIKNDKIKQIFNIMQR
jgi:ArsR family transcriptional regulator, lead/cadmium/zinc/bismuth-responsive transcriptional repressor